MVKGKRVNLVLTFGLVLVTAILSLIPSPAWAPPDSDGDGVANNRDLCPDTPAGEGVDSNGCSASQLDTDGDGIYNNVDLCPDTPMGEQTNPSGCPDLDRDTFYADVDCNDTISSVFPGASEICDGIDNQCPGDAGYGTTDEGCGGGTVDSDGDGLSDTLEQTTGVTLSPDLTLLSRDGSSVPGGGRYLPPCSGTFTPNDPARALCVDWATPDLFVIVNRASGCPDPDCYPFYDNDASGSAESNLPISPPFSGTSNPPYFDPFAVISAPQGSANRGGLGVAVHECIQDSTSTDQHIAEETYAVRAREDLSIGGYLGLSTPGTPGPNTALTIWTERIKRSIFEKCTAIPDGAPEPTAHTCEDSVTGASITIPVTSVLTYENSQSLLRPFYISYIQNILSHELGHTVNLVPDQLHYPSGSGVVMEISIAADVTVRRNGTVKSILYITTDYNYDSKLNFRLK